MNNRQIKELQFKIGTTPDGFWGPKSEAACRAYLRKLMPSPSPWPKADQKSLTEFYGPANSEAGLVSIDVSALRVHYEGEKCRVIRCHRKVAASLLDILTEINRGPDAWVLEKYAGVYNPRPMRGGSLPSLHARGAAIDLAPNTNGNRTHWPTQANMPLTVMEVFAKRGWVAAGAFWSRDAMHFQATSV